MRLAYPGSPAKSQTVKKADPEQSARRPKGSEHIPWIPKVFGILQILRQSNISAGGDHAPSVTATLSVRRIRWFRQAVSKQQTVTRYRDFVDFRVEWRQYHINCTDESYTTYPPLQKTELHHSPLRPALRTYIENKTDMQADTDTQTYINMQKTGQ